MAGSGDIAGKITSLQKLLHEKFGVRERALARMLKKVGRRLPRRMHARARALMEAETLAANPKLARQMDTSGLERGYAELVAYLEKIDPVEQRKSAMLRLAGILAFNFLVVVGAFIYWLWWAGYV